MRCLYTGHSKWIDFKKGNLEKVKDSTDCLCKEKIASIDMGVPSLHTKLMRRNGEPVATPPVLEPDPQAMTKTILVKEREGKREATSWCSFKEGNYEVRCIDEEKGFQLHSVKDVFRKRPPPHMRAVIKAKSNLVFVTART